MGWMDGWVGEREYSSLCDLVTPMCLVLYGTRTLVALSPLPLRERL